MTTTYMTTPQMTKP
jgi:hypothetical protein